jgi:hypothetical protein
MPIDSRLGGLVISDKNILVFSITKKDVETVPVTRSTLRGPRNCPSCQTEQLKTPRRYDDAISPTVRQNLLMEYSTSKYTQ